MQLLSNLGKVIFPRYCFGCGRSGSYWCHDCSDAYQYDDRCYICNDKKSGFLKHQGCDGYAKGCLVMYQYRDGMTKLLQAGKYFGHYKVYDFIGSQTAKQMICSGMIDQLGSNVIISYVPLYYKKQYRKRGYNQGKLIADSITKHTGIDTVSIFTKTKSTKQQSWLNKSQRHQNLENAFLLHQEIFGYSDIILVDDVMSTGSTLQTLSKMLKESNPDLNIRYIVVARSE